MGAKRGAPRNVLNALAGWEVSPCDCVGLGIQKFIYLLLLIHNLKETAERGALGLWKVSGIAVCIINKERANQCVSVKDGAKFSLSSSCRDKSCACPKSGWCPPTCALGASEPKLGLGMLGGMRWTALRCRQPAVSARSLPCAASRLGCLWGLPICHTALLMTIFPCPVQIYDGCSHYYRRANEVGFSWLICNSRGLNGGCHKTCPRSSLWRQVVSCCLDIL